MQTPSTDRSHRRSEMLAAQRLVALPAVCDALRSTGTFDRLLDGAATIEELTAHLGLDREGVRRLLAAAERLGVVERDGNDWTTPVSRDVLAELDRGWLSLDATLRGGERVERSDDARQAGAAYSTMVRSMPELYGRAPDRLVELLDPPADRILDVGAGAAAWSIAMLLAWPDATVTALDLPDVVAITERAVADHGVAGRSRVVGADLWVTEFDPEFDLIVVAGVCHLFAVDRVARLLARVVRWLRPGGRVVVVDAGGGDDSTCVDAAIHDLSLWLRSGGGHRDAATHLRWLIDAGLSRAATLDLGIDHLVAVSAIVEEQT